MLELLARAMLAIHGERPGHAGRAAVRVRVRVRVRIRVRVRARARIRVRARVRARVGVPCWECLLIFEFQFSPSVIENMIRKDV